MKKSVIIATATIVIAVALVASYVWYGDGGDDGSDTPENTEPVLSNYINTSSFFELYIDGTMITPFNMPRPLEPQGNVIELRPVDRVDSVTDNNDGTYAFTLVNETGATHTLTVETANMSNIVSSVSDRIITLTFDAEGIVTLIMDLGDFGNALPGGNSATVTGCDIEGKGWSVIIDGTPVESAQFPVTIPKTGAIIQIVADSKIHGEIFSQSLMRVIFNVPGERHSFHLMIDLDGAEVTSSSKEDKTITLVVDCDSSMSIKLHSYYNG